MKNKTRWIILFLTPTCLLFLLIYALPLVLVFSNSLFDYRLFPNRYIFTGLSNFKELLTNDPTFIKAFVNTMVWILIHCTIHIILGTLLAFILYKKPFGWKFVRVTYMIPNIISQSAIAMIFLNIFNPGFGALNAILKAVGLEILQHNWLFENGTAFPSVTMTWLLFAGYTTTLVLAQALSVDESIIEAAQVDGASSFQIDIFVMYPLVRKMIGTTVLMAAAYMLQLFSLIYITTNGGPGATTTNLPLMVYQAMKAGNYGSANAIGVFIIIVGAISMVFINKLFHMDRDY
jgi:raffinose/stachyose/melibiose transport system permease protein